MASGGAAAGAAVAEAAGQIASPFIQGAFTLGGIALQNKYNKELAAIQNQYNIDMWKMQADYNSPANQMKRFEEAGLNPNLIYGQGSSGNMSSAPQLVAPQAPDVQGALEKIGRAFNLQNLILNSYKIKEAKEEARIKELQRFDAEDERDAMARFGDLYDYDMQTGRFVPTLGGIDTTIPNPRGSRIGDRGTAPAHLTRLIGLSDPKMSLQQLQRAYLNPQITMSNYDAKYYPYSFWIGQGSKITSAIGDLGGLFLKIPTKFGNNRSFTPQGSNRRYYY